MRAAWNIHKTEGYNDVNDNNDGSLPLNTDIYDLDEQTPQLNNDIVDLPQYPDSFNLENEES
jgi:hypothetical protein